MQGELRVGLRPSGGGGLELVQKGHDVLVGTQAGLGSGFADEAYSAVGARVISSDDVWNKSDLVVKIKEPLSREFQYLRNGLMIAGFFHAGSPHNLPLVHALCDSKVTAIDYGAIQLDDGSTPVLAAMSKVAGWIMFYEAGKLLMDYKRTLIGPDTKALVIGLGNAGTTLVGLLLQAGATLYAMEINPQRRKQVRDQYHTFLEREGSGAENKLECEAYNQEQLAEILKKVDLAFGTANNPARQRQETLVPRAMTQKMQPGSIVGDISIDNGGCFEASRKTSLDQRTFVDENGVVFYCVPNMPAIAPGISTPALTTLTFPYFLAIAEKGIVRAALEDPSLARGIITYAGKVTHRGIAESVGKEYVPLRELLAG